MGPNSGTCRQRAQALRRLGHKVCTLAPRSFLPDNSWINFWIWRTGARFMEAVLARRVLAALPDCDFDLVWIDGGDLIAPSLVRELKNRFGRVINYNIDDPYGSRDSRRWRLYLESLPFYDLLIVMREQNVLEARSLGAKNVLRVFMSADEIAHAPRQLDAADWQKWASEVLFLGTWMPDRGPFLSRLVELGVPLAIYGDRWQKAREWSRLRSHWRGAGLHSTDDYAKAIQCAKICLGLLSKGNRDLHTTRSSEIPFLGSLFCAERTSEHMSLYSDGVEAVFWDSPEECAKHCFQLLADNELRATIARNGQARCIRNGTLNQPTLLSILQAALAEDQSAV